MFFICLAFSCNYLQAIVYRRPSFYNTAVAAVFTREGLLSRCECIGPTFLLVEKHCRGGSYNICFRRGCCHFLISLGNIGKRKLHGCKNQAATFISCRSWLILFWWQYHDCCMPPNISTYCMQKRRALLDIFPSKEKCFNKATRISTCLLPMASLCHQEQMGATAAWRIWEIAYLIYWKRMWDNQIHTRLRGFQRQKGGWDLGRADRACLHILSIVPWRILEIM